MSMVCISSRAETSIEFRVVTLKKLLIDAKSWFWARIRHALLTFENNMFTNFRDNARGKKRPVANESAPSRHAPVTSTAETEKLERQKNNTLLLFWISRVDFVHIRPEKSPANEDFDRNEWLCRTDAGLARRRLDQGHFRGCNSAYWWVSNPALCDLPPKVI